MGDTHNIKRIFVATIVGGLMLVAGFGTGSFVSTAVAQSEGSGDGESTSAESDGAEADVDPGAADSSADQKNRREGEESSDDSQKKSADKGQKDGEKTKSSAEGTEESSGPALPEGAGEKFAGQLEEFRESYKRYVNEIGDYQGTINSFVDAEYSRQKARINKKFDQRAEYLRGIERERRLGAIERFEKFIEKHPNHPKYTPDAMFRLAELYFEKENDEYLQADERYQKEMKRYQKGRRPSPPKSPRRDYTDTISVFSELIHEWPDYRLLDGAYYLLAYCHDQMGNPRKARDLFAELVVKRPTSEFVPEAWIRIGEFHFDRSDNPGEIEMAKNAYQQSMKYEDSRYFDKALYKLAWSHYRLDSFHKAIVNFERLVEYSDEKKAETGQSGSVLRAEAIKYIAVSLAEEDWDLDRKVDDDFGMPRVKKYLDEGKAYEREVITELVDYLFEHTRYDIAENVIRYALERYPNHPKNPQLHEKLIIALMRPPRKLDKAFAERRKLNDLYGPESDWYAYQKRKGNEEAVDYGDNLIRENLIQAATWYHEQAQKMKDEARVKQDSQLLAKAKKRYRKAARAYEQFLKRYPDDKDIYRWNFYYADSLYYSGQYKKAYEQYRVVRELDIENNKFQPDAAFNAVKALEFRLKKLVDNGKLPDFIVPEGNREEARNTAREQQSRQKQKGKEEQKTADGSDEKGPEIKPKPVPAMAKKYITAMDRYVVLDVDYKKDKALDAKFAFNAAKIYYDLKHYDEARERFTWIVDNFPDREEAYLAGSLILETHRQEKNYDKLAEWADKLSGVLKGEQAKAVKEEVREFKLGAMFKSAEKLFDQKKYEKAAEEYVKLVNKAPDHENAPRALNNAAVAYEELKRYDSAMDLYQRVYREYNESPLAGYALYRVAVNSERFFEFDNAIRTYTLFYEEYEGKSPEELEKMDFMIEEKRPKALLSAAVLSGNLQRYRKAAKLYEQFVETYPNNDEAPTAQWQAVENWKKAGDKDAMIDAFEVYKREFGGDPERADKVLEGMMRIAERYEKQGRDERAQDKYREIIDTFETRKLEPGSDSAYYAAKSQFQLAERTYQEWKEIKIEGTLKEQKKILQKKIKEQKKVQKDFKKVWEYNNLEYTLASSFRLGSLYQHFAESLYNVPIPFQPGSKQYMMYRRQLDKVARPLEDKAVERYKKTIEKAREQKIVNKWTKKTLDQLNKYRPAEYPLYKESRTAEQRDTVTGHPFMSEMPEETGSSKLDSGGPAEEKGGDSNEADSSNSEGGAGEGSKSTSDKTSSDSAGNDTTSKGDEKS